jgi:hypothetical protein
MTSELTTAIIVSTSTGCCLDFSCAFVMDAVMSKDETSKIAISFIWLGTFIIFMGEFQ